MHRFFAPALLGLAATLAGAQTITLEEVTTVPTSGADLATFDRGVSHFTYDLTIDTTGIPSDWTAAEVSVDVLGTGRIWHASDETNFGPPLENLNVPFLDDGSTNTKVFDTFFTVPGATFFTPPTFAAPGGIISTDTQIRGIGATGNVIPLAWFDTAINPNGEQFVGIRITFEVPDSFGPGELSLDPTGRELFATIVGRATSAANTDGVPFSFDLYAEVDCNDNGVGDTFEIDSGAARDFNGNGAPDECDATIVAGCTARGAAVARLSNAEPGTNVTFTLDGGRATTRTVNAAGQATAFFRNAGSGAHTVTATHADGWSKDIQISCP